MKRAHRKWHRLAWWLLTPSIAVLVWLALNARIDLPANAELPAPLARPVAVEGG